MKLTKMHWIGIIAAAVIVALDLIFFSRDQRMLLFLLGIAIGALALPFVIGVSLENKKEQKTSEMFLEFSRNLAESVTAGTPISKGIINMRKKNYGVLNPNIEKMANQIELGIPVEKALQTFANDVNSPVVRRAVALIRQAERAGGEIDYILDSTAKSVSEIEKLKKERKSATYNLVVQGYIIFFIFIGIILVLEFKIIPLTAGVSAFSGFASGNLGADLTGTQTLDAAEFTQPFLFLLLSQGLFAGLVIGKLSEGSVKKGIKHSFVLMITAYLISTGARLFVTPATVS